MQLRQYKEGHIDWFYTKNNSLTIIGGHLGFLQLWWCVFFFSIFHPFLSSLKHMYCLSLKKRFRARCSSVDPELDPGPIPGCWHYAAKSRKHHAVAMDHAAWPSPCTHRGKRFSTLAGETTVSAVITWCSWTSSEQVVTDVQEAPIPDVEGCKACTFLQDGHHLVSIVRHAPQVSHNIINQPLWRALWDKVVRSPMPCHVTCQWGGHGHVQVGEGPHSHALVGVCTRLASRSKVTLFR